MAAFIVAVDPSDKFSKRLATVVPMRRRRVAISSIIAATFSCTNLYAADCNSNGVDDAAEITAGTTPDCNENGIPDDCDIASGTSLDLDTNGIADECLRFVDVDADPGGDGLSWVTAYDHLVSALQEAQTNGLVAQVWVAEGTYLPDGGSISPDAVATTGDGNRSSSFRLLPGLAIYGGFGGWERRSDQRNSVLHPTILSGDIGTADFSGDNSLHVVQCTTCDAASRLDGFTVCHGRADTIGGGLYISAGSPQIVDCLILENHAETGGGAAVTSTSEPVFTNCRIILNSAAGLSGKRLGGGVCLYQNDGIPKFVNCLFLANNSAIALRNSGVPGNSRPIFQNCTIANNGAGGGVYVYQSDSPTFRSCIIWGNSGTAIESNSESTVITYSCLQSSWVGEGNILVDPQFIDPEGIDGQTGTADDNVRLSSTSPCIDAGNNNGVLLDSADLDRDGITLERTPLDLDGELRFLDDPLTLDTGLPDSSRSGEPIVDMGAYEFRRIDCDSNGIPDDCDNDCGPAGGVCDLPGCGQIVDCNTNDVPDSCDIAGSVSLDCQLDGIPDECQISGDIYSTWASTSGLWSQPPNWCPDRIPNNVPGEFYNVTVGGPQSIATLDMSPTLESLICTNGATIEVNASSGASVRFLAVGAPIQNDGVLRAADGMRLLIDATDINQTSNGVIEAVGAPGEASKIQINGKVVSGGRARTSGDAAAIELLGGATLDNVIVEGNVGLREVADRPAVVVPNGQSGRLGGTIVNEGGIRVDADTAPTLLIPAAGGVQLAGGAAVTLTDEATASIGWFSGKITNRAGHRIEGEGILFGEIINSNGFIVANSAQRTLLISAPGDKVNDGILRATSNGLLAIWSDVTGDGDLEALDGGTIAVDDSNVQGHHLVARAGTIFISAATVVCSDGVDLPPDAAFAPPAGLMISGSMFRGTDGLDIAHGIVSIESHSTAEITDGPIVVCPDVITNPAAVAELHVADASSSIKAVSLELCSNGVLDIAGELALTGTLSFNNVDETDWEFVSGSRLVMYGGAGLPPDSPEGYAQLEIGGEDFGDNPVTHEGNSNGFVQNFDLQELVIGPDAHVVLVDNIDNGNRGGVGGASEALYVETLRFADSKGILDLNGLHLYYRHLCLAGDATCDGDVDLRDFARFQVCYGAALTGAGCEHLDFDMNGMINSADYGVFGDAITGPK